MSDWKKRIAEIRQERENLDFLIKEASISGRWSMKEKLEEKYRATHEEYNKLLKIEFEESQKQHELKG